MQRDLNNLSLDVPRDLLLASDRAEAAFSSVFWIRTWFGRKDDKASQEAADAAYRRLYVWALLDTEEDGDMTIIAEKEVYDSKEELLSNSYEPADIVDGIALGTPGSVPGYVVTALIHCPDSLDAGSSLWDETPISEAEEDEMDRYPEGQEVLVFVADRQACEEGWVLQLAINHRGKALPFRYRGKANKAGIYSANWSDGQKLAENCHDPAEDREDREDSRPGASGWGF